MNKPDKKNDIILAAKKEFASHGREGARLQNIAKRAEVPQALIHYYFSTKDNLYTQVIHWLFDQRLKSFGDDLYLYAESLKLDPPEHLYLIAYAITRQSLRNFDPDLSRLLRFSIDNQTEISSVNHLIDEFALPFMKKIESIILEGINKDCFEHDDPMLLVFQILSMLTFYSQDLENFQGTKMYENLTGGNRSERIQNFILKSIFKSLQPENRKFTMPSIPDGVSAYIEKLIEKHGQKQT